MIASGTRLGPYEIVSRLGAGGMGEVWRARDTRLDRSVAIKILPAEFAENAQFKLRFEREGKTISQLEHANICRLYDIGEERGANGPVAYLVMELLDGESLADRLARGPLPLRDVLHYGVQIAEALDRAHRAGIVHRDLKPGNIMMTKSGAKLLDFGLAKASAVGAISGSAPASPDGATEHRPLTEQGTIIGTFQYMAPEQLEGQEADPRTDIFAFGAVLYEMVTGRRAFEGKTKTSLIAAIVKEDPRPVSELQPLTPPALEHIIFRCLAKDPDDRLQSAHDLAEELRWIATSSSPAVSPVAVRPQRKVPAALLAAIAALAGAGGMWLALRAPRPARTVRVHLAIPAPSPSGGNASTNLAISPDGKWVAATLRAGNRLQLCLRNIEKFDFTPIAGTELATCPFFSPDGQWIGFFVPGALKKVSVNGGAPQTLAPVLVGRGGSWSPDGTIYYTPDPGSGLWSIPAAGGTPKQVTRPDAKSGENSHRWPYVLPDGKHILFTVRTDRIGSFDDASIAVLDTASGEKKTLVEGGSYPRYLPTGHLLFARAGRLFAIPFDAGSLRTHGSAVPVVDGLTTLPPSGGAFFDVASGTGDLLYLAGGARGGKTTVYAADRHGTMRQLALLNQTALDPEVSPDQERIVFRVAAANDDVWVYEIARETFTRVSFEPGNETRAVWMPDSRRIVFGSERNSSPAVLWRYADGSGSGEEIVVGSTDDPTSCSPDGKRVAFLRTGEKSGQDIWIASIGGKSDAQPLLRTPYNESSGMFSPDGALLAYVSDESGATEVYVRSVAPGGGRWQVSIDGGEDPRWSRDGKEIFFRRNDEFHAATVSQGPPVRVGRPALLFSAPDINAYDVLRDGFLLTRNLDEALPFTYFNLVLNWREELVRRVPR